MEAAIKASGKFENVRDYEDSLENDKTKQASLRFCRMARNHIVHENADFFEVSDKMIEFVEDLSVEFNEENIPVKKKMFSMRNAIKDTDLLVVAADFMTKKKQHIIPVFDKTDYSIGVLTYENIVKYIAAGDFTKAKKVAAVTNKHKFGFIKDDTPMSKVRVLTEKHDRVYLILNDNKKIVGWII